MTKQNGFDIATTAQRLRRYAYIEKQCLKISAGWFLRAPAYETKYAFAYHLWDHAEHVTWLRNRLKELRGGNPDASPEPALVTLMSEALHAPSADALIHGLYGVVKRELLATYKRHIAEADRAANASEVRMLGRLASDLETQLAWYDGLDLTPADDWREHVNDLLDRAGGVTGEQDITSSEPLLPFKSERFVRPKQIHFDERIRRGELTPYDVRQTLEKDRATAEQFKVFFNEMYAAALLASVIFDAADDKQPWEIYASICHHFWDEARHSQFGAVRLKELGYEPDVCDPILYEQAESLPALHRICYLALGLEIHFMSRKKPRVLEYKNAGDERSQLFADHDWSDEINHVRYGKAWVDYWLEDDFRTVEDIQAEIREHLAAATGTSQEVISTPF